MNAKCIPRCHWKIAQIIHDMGLGLQVDVSLLKALRKKSAGRTFGKQHEELMNEVANLVRPEEQLPEVDEMIADINSRIKNLNIPAVCTPGGSLAKGTYLKDEFDVDLFVKFAPSYDDDISNALESILHELPYERIHGSRDYFRISWKGIEFEIVPVLDVTKVEDMQNVTDATPLHVTWALERLKPEQQDDIRVAKKFCKAFGLYGAESYISGFSGHVLDILILHYGSFSLLVEAASDWKEELVIDVSSHHDDPKAAMNESKLVSPLLIVDPIQPNRNAAAAISREAYDQFKVACMLYLLSPNEDFFQSEDFDGGQYGSSVGSPVYALPCNMSDAKRDVAGSKIVKVGEFVCRSLLHNAFAVLQWDAHYDHASKSGLLYFVVEKSTIDKEFELQGPPIKIKQHADDFVKAHPNAKEKNGRLVAIAEREYVNAGKLLLFLISLNEVTSRCESVKVITYD